MAAAPRSPFPPEALEVNRRGELTDAQLQALRSLAQAQRKSAISSAGFLLAAAVLIGFFASPSASIVLRVLFTVGCLAIAAFLVVRSISGGDALTRDLGHGRVESVEGAIGKSRVSAGRVTSYFLDVGDSRFKVMPFTFEAAPDAGYVRVYFLPQSRKVVNLEHLPDHPVERGTTMTDIVHAVGAVAHSTGRRERNEARAALAGIGSAMKGALAQPVASPAAALDPRPLGEAIVGTWSNGFVTASFAADGRVTSNVLGRANAGRWSVDADGRLHVDVTGQSQVVAAELRGNQLTVSIDGEVLVFTRDT